MPVWWRERGRMMSRVTFYQGSSFVYKESQIMNMVPLLFAYSYFNKLHNCYLKNVCPILDANCYAIFLVANGWRIANRESWSWRRAHLDGPRACGHDHFNRGSPPRRSSSKKPRLDAGVLGFRITLTFYCRDAAAATLSIQLYGIYIHIAFIISSTFIPI